jgi:hypothetical protein
MSRSVPLVENVDFEAQADREEGSSVLDLQALDVVREHQDGPLGTGGQSLLSILAG